MKEIITKATGELAYAQDFIKYTKLEIDDIKHTFFKIGFRLNEAQACGYYRALGYEDIYALAKAEFGFEKTSTKNLMAVNRAYSGNGSYSRVIAEHYDKYSQTQLVEMLPLSAFERQYVPTDMTVADLRDYKKGLKLLSSGAERNKAVANPVALAERYREELKEQDKPKYKEALDIPPGQLVMSDDSITEFYQSGAEEKLKEVLSEAEETDTTEAFNPSDYLLSEEEMRRAESSFAHDYEQAKIQERARASIKRYNFKNKKERENFIKDVNNYPVVVLENEELGLTVRRLDFANGAKVYRTDYKINVGSSEPYYIEEYGLSLVRKGDVFSPNSSSIDGIVAYMTKQKNEI